METLPYELYDSILQYVNQSDKLYVIESSRQSRLFSYLLQIYTIRNFDHKFNKKQCLVKITTDNIHFNKDDIYVKHRPELGQYMPLTLRSLSISITTQQNMVSSSTKFKYVTNKLNELVYASEEYHDLSQYEIKKLSFISYTSFQSTFRRFPRGLEMLRLTAPARHEIDFKYIPDTVKHLSLRNTFQEQIFSLPSKLETLQLSQQYNNDLPELPKSLKTIEIPHRFDHNWNVIYNSNVTKLIFVVPMLTQLTKDLLDRFVKIKYFKIISNYMTLNHCPPNIEQLIVKDCVINFQLPITVKKLTCTEYIPETPHNITTLIHNFNCKYTNDIRINFPQLTTLDVTQDDISVDFPLTLVKLTIRNYTQQTNIDKLTKLKILKIHNNQQLCSISVPGDLIYLKLNYRYIKKISINNLPLLKKLETNCYSTNLHLLPSLKYLICPKSSDIPKHVKYITLL